MLFSANKPKMKTKQERRVEIKSWTEKRFFFCFPFLAYLFNIDDVRVCCVQCKRNDAHRHCNVLYCEFHESFAFSFLQHRNVFSPPSPIFASRNCSERKLKCFGKCQPEERREKKNEEESTGRNGRKTNQRKIQVEWIIGTV